MQNNSDHLAGGAGGGVQAAVQRLMAVFDRCGVIAGNYRSTVEAALRAELACPQEDVMAVTDVELQSFRRTYMHFNGGFSDEAMLRALEQFASQRVPVALPQEPVRVTDAMVEAYLTANDDYWTRTDQMPDKNPSRWRQGTPKEATRESLNAIFALLATPAPKDAGPHAQHLSDLHDAHNSFETEWQRQQATLGAPAPKGGAKDAARYQWLRELPNADALGLRYCGSDLDNVVDAAILASKGGAA